MKIRLVVGRYKAEEIIEVADFAVSADFIAERLCERSLRHLHSRDVEAIWDMETKTGKVYAGFHCVGNAEVVGTDGSFTGPPEQFYVHYVGGRLYTPERFAREAKRLGVARAIPKPFLRKLKWGDTILLAKWAVREADRKRRAGRMGTAEVFGYFHLTGVNIAASPEAREKIHALIKSDREEVRAVKVERECGSYFVVLVSYTKEPLSRIVEAAEQVEEKTGERIRLFMTGGFEAIDPHVTLDPIGFTRSVTTTWIQTRAYAPFMDPPALREVAWVLDYSQRRYVKKSDRERLEAATGGVAGSVSP